MPDLHLPVRQAVCAQDKACRAEAFRSERQRGYHRIRTVYQRTITTSYHNPHDPLGISLGESRAKYIIIVAAASKYGDYFIGGVGSTLWLDEMELVYE